MSRIGKMPIQVPANVEVSLSDTKLLTVKGPKGTLTQQIRPEISLEIANGVINVTRASDDKQIRAYHGLTRALVADMVNGVVNEFSTKLEINGVGYRAAKQGKQLVLNLGYSHNVVFEEEDGITFDVPDPNTIIVHGPSKQRVGQVAANIREKRPPEPYLGKGIKYADEFIRRKSGKAGK